MCSRWCAWHIIVFTLPGYSVTMQLQGRTYCFIGFLSVLIAHLGIIREAWVGAELLALRMWLS
jgi:hypothetical protein